MYIDGKGYTLLTLEEIIKVINSILMNYSDITC